MHMNGMKSTNKSDSQNRKGFAGLFRKFGKRSTAGRVKKKASKPIRLRVYAAFWIFFIAVCSVAICLQLDKAKEKELQAATLEQELADAKQEEQDIKDLIEFKKTSEYAEQQAREKLGWVYSDEIIFHVED
jgi:cell division protein FtsB